MSKKKHDVPEELLASGFRIRSKDQGFEAQLYVFADADGQQLFRDLGSRKWLPVPTSGSILESLDRTGNHLRTPDRNEQEETTYLKSCWPRGFPNPQQRPGFEAQLYVFCRCGWPATLSDLGSLFSSNLKDRSKESLDRSLRLELATTYGPQIAMSKKKHDVRVAGSISESAAKTRARGSTVCLADADGQQFQRKARFSSTSRIDPRSPGSILEVGTGNHLRTPDRNEQEET